MILTFDDGYLDTYHFAYPILREFGMKGVVFVLGDREIKTNIWDQHLGLPAAPLMEARQIVEMHAAGFEIGAHSMSHAKLTTLSREEAWEEIARARMVLEIFVNSAVRSFAYPYGLVNDTIKRMVSDAGYTMACSVFTGPATFGVEPYEIRRIAIQSTTSTVGFGMRLLTPFQSYEWIRWKAIYGLSVFDGRRSWNGQAMWEKKCEANSAISQSKIGNDKASERST